MTTQLSPRKAHDSRALPVVSALEGHGLIDPSRHDEALDVVARVLAGRTVETTTLRRRLAELAGYVGGAFVVVAAGIFVAEQWGDMSLWLQVGLLAGVALLLFAVGVTLGVTGGGLPALREGTQPVRRRLASVLFTAGAVAGAGAALVWVLDVVESRGIEQQSGSLVGLAGALTLVVLASVGYALAPSLLGQGAVAFGTAYAVPFTVDSFDVVGDMDMRVLGALFVVVGALWLGLAETGVWREVEPGRVIGAGFLLVGAQVPLAGDPVWVAYLATFLVGAGGFAVYLVRRAWPYLALGVAGVTLAVPEALFDWTEGALGPAGVLLAAGVTLLAASLLGLRLRKEVTAG